jgi:hypothetical protein
MSTLTKSVTLFLTIVLLGVFMAACGEGNAGNIMNEPGNAASEEPQYTQTAAQIVDLNEKIRDYMNDLPEGSASLIIPERMRVGEMSPVFARVFLPSSEDMEEQLEAEIAADLPEDYQTVPFETKVNAKMRAILSGASFDIVPLSGDQFTSPDEITEWEWEVTPQKSGEQALRLTLRVLVEVEGLGEETWSTTQSKTVGVDVNPGYSVRSFLSSYWQWIISGILIPLVPFIYSLVRRRISS